MADDDVLLTDLEVIQRYSLAVRGASASRTELVAALQADLAWLQGSRRSAPAKSADKTADKPADKPADKAAAKTPDRSPAKAPAKAAAPVPVRAPAKKAPTKAASTKRRA